MTEINQEFEAFQKHIAAVEHALIVTLERAIREMFAFTGWEDDVDDEARLAVLRVRSMLNDIDAIRKIQGIQSAIRS